MTELSAALQNIIATAKPVDNFLGLLESESEHLLTPTDLELLASDEKEVAENITKASGIKLEAIAQRVAIKKCCFF